MATSQLVTCHPNALKRARIDELPQQNENEAHLIETEVTTVIMQDRPSNEAGQSNLVACVIS